MTEEELRLFSEFLGNRKNREEKLHGNNGIPEPKEVELKIQRGPKGPGLGSGWQPALVKPAKEPKSVTILSNSGKSDLKDKIIDGLKSINNKDDKKK